MKKLQFFVTYTLSGFSANNILSMAIEIQVFSNDSADSKAKDILRQIAKTHNLNYTKRYGFIDINHICITNLTRLD